MNENGMNNKRNVYKWNQGREEIKMTPKKANRKHEETTRETN